MSVARALFIDVRSALNIVSGSRLSRRIEVPGIERDLIRWTGGRHPCAIYPLWTTLGGGQRRGSGGKSVRSSSGSHDLASEQRSELRRRQEGSCNLPEGEDTPTSTVKLGQHSSTQALSQEYEAR